MELKTSTRVSNSSKKKAVISPFTLFGNNYSNAKLNNGDNYNLSSLIVGGENSSINISEEYLKNNIDNFNLFDINNINTNIDNHINHAPLEINSDFLNKMNDSKISESLKKYIDEFFKFWKSEDPTIKDLVSHFYSLNIKESNYKWERMNDIDLTKIPISDEEINIPEIKIIHNQTEGTTKTNYDEIYKTGLQGRIGFYVKVKDYDVDDENSEPTPSDEPYKLAWFIGPGYYTVLSNFVETQSTNIVGIVPMDNMYSNSFFKPNSSELNLDFILNYFDILGSEFNFTTKYKSEILYNNIEEKTQIKFVDWTNNSRSGSKFQNAVNLKFTDKIDRFNEYFPTTIVINQLYANMTSSGIGSKLKFNVGSTIYEWIVSGIATDYNEIYPLINDQSLIPDGEAETIIYVNRSFFADKSTISDSQVSDKSKLLFEYNSNNLENDFKKMKDEVRLNSLDINNTKDFNNLKTYDSIKNFLYTGLFDSAISIFLIFVLVLFLIFLSIGLTSSIVLIKKDINNNLSQIGILKAQGISTFTLSICYSSTILIPLLLSFVISYVVMFATQFQVLSIFQTYFNLIPSVNSFIFESFGLCILIGIVLFFITTAFVSSILKTNTALLMSNKLGDKHPKKPRIKFKKTINMLSYSLISRASKKVIVLLSTIFIVSLLMSGTILAPVAVKNVQENYFLNKEYEGGSAYQTGIVNSPLSRTTKYKYDIEESKNILDDKLLFPTHYSIGKEDKLYSMSDIDINAEVPGVASTFKTQITNLVGFEFVSLLSKSFSIESLEKLTKVFEEDGKDQSEISELFMLAISKGLAPMVGIDVSTAADWKSALMMILSVIMPSELLMTWSDEIKRENFSTDVNSTSFNKEVDDLATVIYSQNDGIKNKVIGLEGDQKSFNIQNELLVDNNAIVSEATAYKMNLKYNDKLDVKSSVKELQVYDSFNKKYMPIENSWWKYIEPSWDLSSDLKLTDLDKKDLTKFTYNFPYANGDYGNGYGMLTPYYTDQDGNQVEYNYMQNIALMIPKNIINKGDDEFKSLWKKDRNNIVYFENQVDDFVIIRPFDWRQGSVDKGKSIYDLQSGFPDTWYSDAFQKKTPSSNSFLKVGNKVINTSLVVKGIVGIYNENLILTSKSLVDELVGFDKYSNSDEWFNAKFSINKGNNEYMERFGIKSSTNNYSPQEMIKTVSNQSSQYFMDGEIIKNLNQIYLILLSIGIIFIILICVVSLISISLISNLFIEDFKKTIVHLKMMGYSNGEIHLFLTKWIFPLSLSLITIGTLIVPIVGTILKSILWSNGIFIPLDFLWMLFLIEIVTISIIFVALYLWSFSYVIKRSIQQQIMWND